MEFSMKKLFASIFLVMVLLATNTGNMVPAGVEGRKCENPSRTFKGICVSNRNCASVCEREGTHDGECDGFRRRCMCKKFVEDLKSPWRIVFCCSCVAAHNN